MELRLAPEDRLAVAARDQEQAFADGRGAGVRGYPHLPIHLVAHATHQVVSGDVLADGFQDVVEVRVIGRHAIAQGGDKRLEGAPTLSLDRLVVLSERSPVLELLDVLQKDHPRPGGLGPLDHDPGKAADFPVHRLAALGLAEVPAVRGGPEDADRLSAGGFDRIHLEHIGDEVLGVRVVGAMDRDRRGVVVDRYVRVPVDACTTVAGAADSGEQVDVQLPFQWERQGLECRHAAGSLSSSVTEAHPLSRLRSS
ncbi:hypothetical protein D9M71_476800 [compost metagenome]